MRTKTASVIYVEIYAEEKEAGDDPLDEIERELAEEEAGVGPAEEEKEDGLGLASFGLDFCTNSLWSRACTWLTQRARARAQAIAKAIA